MSKRQPSPRPFVFISNEGFHKLDINAKAVYLAAATAELARLNAISMGELRDSAHLPDHTSPEKSST